MFTTTPFFLSSIESKHVRIRHSLLQQSQSKAKDQSKQRNARAKGIIQGNNHQTSKSVLYTKLTLPLSMHIRGGPRIELR